MAKRKNPEIVPSFRDLLVKTVEEFCAESGIDGAFIIEEIAEDTQAVPPSQSTCVYKVVVNYWLPAASIMNPVEFLAERGVKNPED